MYMPLVRARVPPRLYDSSAPQTPAQADEDVNSDDDVPVVEDPPVIEDEDIQMADNDANDAEPDDEDLGGEPMDVDEDVDEDAIHGVPISTSSV